MSIRKRRRELLRLREAFEEEASEFPDTRLSILYLTQMKPLAGRTFHKESHVVMLWQYYGTVSDTRQVDALLANLEQSDIETIGVRGSEFSCYALIEGHKSKHFVRMARRAGCVFSEKETQEIQMNAIDDFKSNLHEYKNRKETKRKPVFAGNDSPLAVWLNYVLYHLGKTHPRYMPEVRIGLDPFAASLSATDDLIESGTISKTKETAQEIDKIRFKVALSFPGEKRAVVSEVADALRLELGGDSVFFDNYYQPELARPNLDLLLQRIYHENSDLVVVFLCADYEQKEWCGLEWRAIRDLIKQKEDKKIMLLRLDHGEVSGILGIDGYLDINNMPPSKVANFIVRRLEPATATKNA